MKMKKLTAALLMVGIMFGGVVLPSDSDDLLSINVSAAEDKLAAPQNVKASASSDSVTLVWKSVKGASGYKIFRYDESSKKYKPAYSTNSTTYTVTGLKPKKTYSFKVAAFVKKNGKTVTGRMSSSIKVGTIPAFPDIVKHGFYKMPDYDSESGREMTSIINSTPGMMVGLAPIDENKSLSEQTEESAALFNNYCDALKKNGFEVEFEGNTISPEDNGYGYNYVYLVNYKGKAVGKVLFIMCFEQSDDANEVLACKAYIIMVIPVTEN